MREFATNLLGEHVEVRTWRDDAPASGVFVVEGVVRAIGSADGGRVMLVIEVGGSPSPWSRASVIGHLPEVSPPGFLVPIVWDWYIGVRVVPKEGATT